MLFHVFDVEEEVVVIRNGWTPKKCVQNGVFMFKGVYVVNSEGVSRGLRVCDGGSVSMDIYVAWNSVM